MEKAKKLNLMLGVIGVFLTFIGSAFAVIGGFHMFLNYLQMFGAGMLTMIAGVVLFVAFIMGIVAVAANTRLAFAVAILSIISSTTIACCLGLPMFDNTWLYSLPIVAVILSFAAFLLFMGFYVKNKQHKPIETDTTIEMESIVQTESADQNGTTAQKRARLTFIIPIAVMAILVTVITPSVRFGVYNWAYKGLLHEMSDMHEGYCIHTVDFNTFDKYLPDSHEDMATIRAEEREYNVFGCMDAMRGDGSRLDDSQTLESRARVAYMRLVELQAVDPRWNFDDFLSHSVCRLHFDNAMWQGDGVYLNIAHVSENEATFIDTNLPYVPTEDGAEMAHEFSESSVVYNETTFEYCYEIALGFYDTHYRRYTCFKLSALNYSADTKQFSIEVYCYVTDTTYTMTYVESADWSDFEW
ncbi:MAG: hypothetical protein HDT36_02225 [Clostridiales bacterium]|nr:hypothetical protein [Clostridiales bacterium]